MNITKLITENNIHIEPRDTMVFVRCNGREVSCVYAATNGNKETALKCALIALARLCRIPFDLPATTLPGHGLRTSYRYGKSEPVTIQDGFNRDPICNHIRQLAAQMAAKELRK